MSIVVNEEILLDKLQILLKKQIKYIRTDRFSELERSLEKTAKLVDEICGLNLHKSSKHWPQIVKIFQTLELMLLSNKQSVNAELQQIGNVRKTLEIYGGKM